MYLVAGLGVTGQSVLRYFQAQGEACYAYDTRDELDVSEMAKQFSDVTFATGELPTSWLTDIDTVVLSPGIALSEPWVAHLRQLGKQVIGDIELFARTVGAPVIGITGSNGKSSVTTLTGLVLEASGLKVATGGNLGQPALDLLIDEQDYDVFVLELSSFQLETTHSLQTVSSTVLNISEDHMDRYDELEDYIQAKTKVFDGTEWAVIPKGFSVEGLVHHSPVVQFSLDSSQAEGLDQFGLQDSHGHTWLAKGEQLLVQLDSMALQGRHHVLNALATMALCEPFAIDKSVYQKVFSTFTGLPHRTQLVVSYEGIEWVNDSKGTNVGATLTAIESIGEQARHQKGKIVLLAGGVGKEADFSPLQPAVHQYCKNVILFGRDRQAIASVLPKEPIHMVETLDEAVSLAAGLAESNDKVLFSPACASFDQFKNYVERGLAFEAYVGDYLQSRERLQ